MYCSGNGIISKTILSTVYEITSRPGRPINQLGDLKTHLDGLLRDPRSLPSKDIDHINKREYCPMRPAHYLNKPLNTDGVTQHSSISGLLGDQ